MLVPVVLATHRSEGHDQRGGVSRIGVFPQLDHVVVQDVDGQVVLDGGMAVQDHGNVVVKKGAALRHHFDTQFPRRLDDHLALFTPGLVVTFDRKSPVRLGATNGAARVFQVVDHCLHVAICPVQNGTR